MLMIKTTIVLCLAIASLTDLAAQVPVPGLEGIVMVGDKVAVDESIEVLTSAPTSATSQVSGSTVASGISRKVSRVLTFSSGSINLVSFSTYRNSTKSSVLQERTESADPLFEGRSFTIVRNGTNAKVSGGDQASLTESDQAQILADLGEAFAWTQALNFPTGPPSQVSLLTRSDSTVTPAFILGPFIAVKSMTLTPISGDSAAALLTFAAKLIISDDCNGAPLVLSGQLVLLPKNRMDLEVTGEGVVIPTEVCAVSPSFEGCSNSASSDSGCRFSVPGVLTTIKVVRTIKKIP